MRMLVVGEGCLDVFHYGECKRLCPEAPVPVFNSLSVTKNGGMAKNVESNLLALGVNVDMCTNNNWESILKTRFVEVNANHMFLRVDESDANYGALNIEDVKQIDFKKYDAVVVSDYNKGFLNPQVLHLISRAHPLTFLDTKKILGDWSEDFSYIKINHKEYEATKHTLTKRLLSKLIMTKGPSGCIHQDNLYPVDSVEVKDTSGAGDTFISALAYTYAKSKDIVESIAFANKCATEVVQKKGVSVV